MEDLKIKSEVEEVISRRSFLRKAAYVAPAVMSLGALNAHAVTTAGTSTFVNFTQSHPATNPVTYTSKETIITQAGTNNVLSGTSVHMPTAPFGNYGIDGASVKTAANNGDAAWSWVNNVFGSAGAWNGIASPGI